MRNYLEESKLNMIRRATAEELGDMLPAVHARFQELHPDWELHILTVDKKENRNEQLDAIIALIEKLKDK